MSRLLFGLGVQGPLIVELQQALADLGFDPHGADGLFGQHTESAVRSFQAATSRNVTGEVSEEEWPVITGSEVPDLEARCLQLTSTFEGHGYTLAEGNWDGAWLTWGIIGFTLKHGEIQAIIEDVQQTAPDCVRAAFGAETETFLHIIGSTAAAQKAWAGSITVGARLAEPWRTHFQCLGGFPQVQAVQRAHAHADYFVPAAATAADLGLISALGVALCFDIQVQNGGASGTLRQMIRASFHGEPEAIVREELANAIANKAQARFQADVRARKLAIATGRGTVHGRTVVLANWGLA